MILKTEKYLPLLDDIDIAENHKKEVIHVLWQFMEDQIDHAFEQHPIQQIKSIGKDFTAAHQRLESEVTSRTTHHVRKEKI